MEALRALHDFTLFSFQKRSIIPTLVTHVYVSIFLEGLRIVSLQNKDLVYVGVGTKDNSNSILRAEPKPIKDNRDLFNGIHRFWIRPCFTHFKTIPTQLSSYLLQTLSTQDI